MIHKLVQESAFLIFLFSLITNLFRNAIRLITYVPPQYVAIRTIKRTVLIPWKSLQQLASLLILYLAYQMRTPFSIIPYNLWANALVDKAHREPLIALYSQVTKTTNNTLLNWRNGTQVGKENPAILHREIVLVVCNNIGTMMATYS